MDIVNQHLSVFNSTNNIMKYILILFALSPLLVNAQDYKSVVKSNNTFGLDAYYLMSDSSDFMISPYSISSAIAMTYAGALGETKEQIKQVFHFPTDSELHKGFSELSKVLKGPYENTSLSIANKLWAGEGCITLNADFVRTNKDYYSAVPEILDFNDPYSASSSINEWTSNNTGGKIKELISPNIITSDVVLILTNAVYFQSNWKKPFDPQKTIMGKFTNQTGNKIDVSYMFNKGIYSCYEDETVDMIEIPYIGDEFSLLVLLPRNSMQELQDYLTPRNLAFWLSCLSPASFELVQIPKFKSTYEAGLKNLLMEMGMVNAFGRAQFEGIGTGSGRIILKDVIHKTFIEVNEEGTEAAAATAVVAILKSYTPEKRFVVDRPFVYAIRHKESNTIVFLGKCSNPEY